MKTKNLSLLPALLLATASSALAEVHYVDVNSTNAMSPYTNWTTAATNIQDAVDAAIAGDEIVVADGIYTPVVVNKTLVLSSLNGPQFTTIDARRSGRCMYLTNSSVLSGFTLTNGNAPEGGGLWCESGSAVATNCVIAGNRAYYGTGGGVYQGTLNNCTLSNNSADGPIRGAGGNASGGGAADCTLNNCMLTGNFVRGAYIGFGGGASGCTLNNCTLTGNFAEGDLVPDLNGLGGGTADCTLHNCIVYFNNAVQGADCYSSTLNYCCTSLQPVSGIGNITNAPFFLDQSSGNLRLQSNSPCINAGLNPLAPAGQDLDGNPRIAGGTVDIGAFEFQSPTSIISYAWLQRYGLPTDGSADSSDPDGDGLTNWQEWRCRTDPTNATSALRLWVSVAGDNNLTVSWQSVVGVNYFLERGTNLAESPTFTLLAAGIPGQPGTTTYADTNAIGVGSYFYRVGVGQ